mgnify:CR=1 FL=1
MSRTRRSFCLAAGASLLAACASTTNQTGAPDQRAVAQLGGGSGKMRAAINFGNPILASRGPNGEPKGVSVDLAREAARRLGLTVELVPFNSAGTVVEAVKAAQVDLAFVAIDPVRAADMEYTAPYVIIEGAYLVRNASPLMRNDEVDRAGTVSEFSGVSKDGAMVLEGQTHTRDGKVILRRMTLSVIAEGRVRQYSERSDDDGATWRVAYDYVYRRR